MSEGHWRWKIGIEAALALLLSAGATSLAGFYPAGLLASLGVMSGLYFAHWPRRDRARAVPLVAAGIVFASTIGVGCAGQPSVEIAGLLVVTAVAGLLTMGYSTGPPGALMFVLACGVSEHAAAPMMQAGGRLAAASIPALVAAGATAACLVVAAPLVFPLGRGAVGQHRGFRELFPGLKLVPAERIMLLRMVLAVGGCGVVGTWLGLSRTYWIALTAVAVLHRSHAWAVALRRAAHRVGGTLAGIGVFYLIAASRPGPVLLVLTLAGLQCATEVVVARHYGLALAFVTPTALLMSVAAGEQHFGALAMTRLVDTLIGAALALLIGWVIREPVPRVRGEWRA